MAGFDFIKGVVEEMEKQSSATQTATRGAVTSTAQVVTAGAEIAARGQSTGPEVRLPGYIVDSSGPFCEGYPPPGQSVDGVQIRTKHKSEDATHARAYSNPNLPNLSITRAHLPVYLYPLETIDSPQISSFRDKVLINEGLFSPLPDENNISQFVSVLNGEVIRRRDPTAIIQNMTSLRFGNSELSALRADIFRIAAGRHWVYREPLYAVPGREMLFIDYASSSQAPITDYTASPAHEINFEIRFLDADFAGYNAVSQQYYETFVVEIRSFEGVIEDPSTFKAGRMMGFTLDITDQLRTNVPEAFMYSLHFFGKEEFANRDLSIPTSNISGPEWLQTAPNIPLLFFADKVGTNPVIKLNHSYYDFVHSTEIPFYAREAENLSYNQFSTIEIQVITNSTMYEKHNHWRHNKSIYRVHQQLKKSDNSKLDLTNKEPCANNDDIMMFPSAQVEQFDAVAKSTTIHFPQYVEFDIHTQQGSAFAAMASLTRMDKYILDLAANTSGRYDKYKILETYRETLDENTQGELDPNLNDRYISEPKMFNTYDIVAFMNDLDKNMIENVYRRQAMFPMGLNPPRRDAFLTTGETEDSRDLDGFWDILNKHVFLSKVFKHITPEKIRSFKDIWGGAPAYSETVAYKVCKYDFHLDGLPNTEPLQEFYFFDNEDINEFKFIDNQVIYGEKYYYRIFAYNLVVGSEYFYSGDVDKESFSDMRTQLAATTKPKLVLVEVPYFEKTIEIRDRPPIFPDVSFLPYKGVDDRLGIILSTNYGEYNLAPIKVLESDQPIIDKMILSSNLDKKGRMLYKGDSPPTSYQIFRLDFPPESYVDFEAASKQNVTYPRNQRADRIFGLPQTSHIKGKGLIHDDEIEPNKDYYYMFRSIDPAGISNPSNIFKIRIISYENGVYLDVKTHNFTKRKKLVKGDLTRFIEIKPSALQSSYSISNSDSSRDSREEYMTVPREIKLGLAEETIWNKYYKLRVKSKITGKTLDINFKFNYKVEENLEIITELEEEKINCPPESSLPAAAAAELRAAMAQSSNSSQQNPATNSARQSPVSSAITRSKSPVGTTSKTRAATSSSSLTPGSGKGTKAIVGEMRTKTPKY